MGPSLNQTRSELNSHYSDRLLFSVLITLLRPTPFGNPYKYWRSGYTVSIAAGAFTPSPHIRMPRLRDRSPCTNRPQMELLASIFELACAAKLPRCGATIHV